MTQDNVWSSKEISYDAPDENGVRAEVNLIKGYANLYELDNSRESTWNAKFYSQNKQAHPSGWIPTNDRNKKMIEMLEEANKEGKFLYYRIEQRRRPKNTEDGKVIDRSITMLDLTNYPGVRKADMGLTNSNTVRSLVGLSWDNEEWFYDEEIAVTNPKEDKQSSYAEKNGIRSAFNMDIKKVAPKPTPSFNKNNDYEPKIWETFDNNGNLNPGSQAVAVPLNIRNFVVTENNKLPENERLDEKQISNMVLILIKIANNVQLAIHNGLEAPNFGFSTHTRARAIIFNLVENEHHFSTNVLKDTDSKKEWALTLQNKAIDLWSWSIQLVEKTHSKKND